MNLGAAEEDHGDERSGRVEAERAALEDIDLGVDALEAAVGHAEADGGEHAVAVGAKRLGERRPWVARNGKLFAKTAFDIIMRNRTITCPAGETERFTTGSTVELEPEACDRCSLRERCTDTSLGHDRTVSIADNELLQHRLRKLTRTASGRARLRERVPVEHRLAHVSRRQGRRARYRGVRKNVFDLRRASAITNLETLHLRRAIAIEA